MRLLRLASASSENGLRVGCAERSTSLFIPQRIFVRSPESQRKRVLIPSALVDQGRAVVSPCSFLDPLSRAAAPKAVIAAPFNKPTQLHCDGSIRWLGQIAVQANLRSLGMRFCVRDAPRRAPAVGSNISRRVAASSNVVLTNLLRLNW